MGTSIILLRNLRFDLPRFHSHPFSIWPCAGIIDPTIRDIYPKALPKKRSLSCGSSQTSCQLTAPFISHVYHLRRRLLKDVALAFQSKYFIFFGTTSQGI